MTREEEIKQAAENYAASVCKDCTARFYCKERIRKCDEYREQVTVYADAAMWADEHPKNIWHDASEEPEGYNRAILCQDAKGDCWVENMFLLHITWNEYIRVEMVDKWAYINDLLPKTKEL